jgi:tellurite resistance protein TerC
MPGNPIHDWALFAAVVIAALATDTFVFNRKPHSINMRRAIVEIAFWICLALAFDVWIYFSRGSQAGLEFLTGYVVEEALSVDNIFIFLLIFRAFQISPRAEHKILYSGIAGAVVFRGILIFAGVALLHRFHFILFVFGAFLIVTGLKMLRPGDRFARPEDNWLVRMTAKILPVAADENGEHFLVKRSGQWLFTRLAVALIAIEVTDILFAVDSVPAVLAITQNAFIVYTSNIFAILSLRALYFGLAGILPRFRFLHQALAAILVYVGGEMMLSSHLHIPTAASLAVVAAIFGIAAGFSLLFPRAVSEPNN